MKVNSFNIDDFNVIGVIKDELKNKMKDVSFYGVKAKDPYISVSNIHISDEDIVGFKNSNVFEKICKEIYRKSIADKKAKYLKLKSKLDFCLNDVKPYQKLITNIEEFSYCGAISELEAFEKRYLKSSGYTKSLYRARLQEFSKIKCS